MVCRYRSLPLICLVAWGSLITWSGAQERPPSPRTTLRISASSAADSTTLATTADSATESVRTEPARIVPQQEPSVLVATLAKPAANPNAKPAPLPARPLVPTAEDPFSRELQQIVIDAMGDLDSSRLPSFDAAEAELNSALNRLEDFVQIDSPNGQAWNQFLRLDDLRETLDSQRPSFRELILIERNMRQNYPGLELQPFTDVRDKLGNVISALKYGSSSETTMRVLNSRMEELLTTLDQPPKGADMERNSLVSRVVTYLHESSQAPGAVARLHDKFKQPNVKIYARENFINDLLKRPVAEPSPVNECILGTRVLGQACLSGGVSVDLAPMHGGALIHLNMNATMTSNNRGYNRGVVLRTTGIAPVFASKQITVTPNGISSLPATVSTNLSTRIHAIEHRLRIVRRIAKKKAAEQKPQADAIAQGRLRRRIQSEYDSQVTKQLNEAGERLADMNRQPRPEWKRLGIERPTYAVYSTSSSVGADAVQAASFQLAAHQPCRIPKPLSAGVIAEVHQSALINALESILGGRTLHHHDLDDLAMQFLGEVPEEIQTEVDGDPWRITFPELNPILFEFDEGLVRFKLMAEQIIGKDRDIRGVAIEATYRPSLSDGKLILTRIGDLNIEVGIRSPTVATQYRSVLRAKFKQILKEEFVTERLDFKQLFPNAPPLEVAALQMDDGWVQVGVR